ncbi:lipopolysaccharide biosynthesis protein [Microbacterium sp. ET2]|uniref:lipopolysaccharide biosynthesis protein n=1 Tax=Microbacterium albipurpureum TaxID=3050384 RepID=UPI00259C776F|nr:lipopolysaccharide biosynthesis protein [Microbacterium sp. ET2 (Ac-2212)]WJL94736.1 lipopolysaccharide biosynthesis protein [Microbacterium sp. ET2 (Ac-2212)]
MTTTNLAHKASRGIMLTMGGLWGRALLQMLSTIVLARLLTPADFGLIAMVGAVMGIAELVRDFGMTGAIIQAQNLSERVWRSLLWLSAFFGLALAGIVALSAPFVAMLYNEPRLVEITLLMAPGVFLSGLVMPLQARATKDLKFGTLASLDVSTMLVGVIAGIVTAFLGWGFWALVAMAGAQFIVRLVVLWAIVRPKFGPPRIVKETWALVGTGGSIFGAELLGYAEKNIDNVIIGAQLGPTALGQYSRAYALFLLPLQQMNGPLGRVALPVLSTLREQGERYRRYIRSAALVIGYLTLPTYAIAAAVAQPLVLLLLGPNWSTAATIFALLGIAGFGQAIGRLRTWIYISLGHSHRQFVYDLVARPLIIAGYLFGIWWGGLYGLVITYGIMTLILLVPGFAFAIRGTFVQGRDIWGPILRPAFMAIIAFGAAFGITRLLPNEIAILEILLGIAAAIVCVGPLFLFRAYRGDVAQLMEFVKRMRKPPRKPAAGSDASAEADAEPLTAPVEPETFAEAAMDEPVVREEEGIVRRDHSDRGPHDSPRPSAMTRREYRRQTD